MKFGIGEDSHQFLDLAGCFGIYLAGVNIPSRYKLLSNSDGDVVYHSLFNAISSAMGGRSIGYYYPHSTGPSKKFFSTIDDMLNSNKCRVNNLGISIIAYEPKLEEYVPKMKKNIAELLSILPIDIGITITSGEGYINKEIKEKGIKATSIVSLLEKREK